MLAAGAAVGAAWWEADAVSLLAESNMWREIKKSNELLAELLAEARLTNRWLEHIASLTGTAQPQQWYPPQGATSGPR